jgi:hypothetical protein
MPDFTITDRQITDHHIARGADMTGAALIQQFRAAAPRRPAPPMPEAGRAAAHRLPEFA